MSRHAAAGDRAFVNEDFAAAIKNYTQALESGASLGDYNTSGIYEARAYAHIKLQQWMEAVQDASRAVEADRSNAKAYLRKGMACYKLEEYETALDAFEEGERLVGQQNPQYGIWAQKCRIALAGDSYKATPTSVTPTVHLPPSPAQPSTSTTHVQAKASAPAVAPAPHPAPAASAAAAASSTSAQAAAESFISDYGFSKNLAPVAVEAHTGKFRHQWYQLGNKVVIDVYAKNQHKDDVTAEISDSKDKLSIRIKAQSSNGSSTPQQSAAAAAGGGVDDGDYALDLDLFDRVADVPIKLEVLRTKVEVTLVKANSNVHWATLEKGKGPAAAGVAAAGLPPEQQQQQPSVRQYPSSKGPKDWNKVEAEVKELEEKGELEDGDPLNNFFKKIFSQGDEDTQRAMMKSFVESNGTVLSTNWKEVGSKPVEFKTPEGADVKKWDV